MLIIGSRALALVAPLLLDREPEDWDFICTLDEAQRWTGEHMPGAELELVRPGKFVAKGNDMIAEFEVPAVGSSGELLLAKPWAESPFGFVPDLDTLYTLKLSHRFLKNSPHFWKTAVDARRMKRAGAKVFDEAWLKQRERETYTYKHPKLMGVSKTDFFDAAHGVQYTYDHDSIHRAVALDGAPAYTRFQVGEVQCDKAKFFECSEQTRLNSVIEETCVLAIERSLVPFPGKLSPRQAWLFSLSKVCSSITSGWWRTWAWDHMFEAIAQYPADYFDRFNAGLGTGIVQLAA